MLPTGLDPWVYIVAGGAIVLLACLCFEIEVSERKRIMPDPIPALAPTTPAATQLISVPAPLAEALTEALAAKADVETRAAGQRAAADALAKAQAAGEQAAQDLADATKKRNVKLGALHLVIDQHLQPGPSPVAPVQAPAPTPASS